MALRKLVAGNWKMNGLAAAAAMPAELAAAPPDPGLRRADLPARHPRRPASPAAPSRSAARTATGSASGAHTGDVSAEMLADAGAVAVIVGHSERRIDHAETDAIVAAQGRRRLARRPDSPSSASARPRPSATPARPSTASRPSSPAPCPTTPAADRLAVAYEPVWAIGTGRTPTLDEIAEVHAYHSRPSSTDRFGPETGGGIRLLYGGSVKPGNAAAIFAVANVDGALVGGASLTAADFGGIIAAAG